MQDIGTMSSEVPESVEDAPAEIEGLFPGLWWNHDRWSARMNRVKELEDELPSADAVGVVDTDADGRACEVVLRDRFENPVIISANGSEYGIYLSHALRLISENCDSETPVYVADLSPDSTFSSFLASLAKVDSPIHLYDHHDWDWDARTSIETVVDELVIDGDQCAAQVLQENVHPNADENLREFLDVTADHDLWIKEDERSDHLSTMSFHLSRERYVDAALEHGADMVRESKELQGLYGESERTAQERANIAVNKAEWLDINNTSVAVTYFGCHQSRVGEMLIKNGADLAVIIQPTLSVSFRSTEEFGRCAELARSLGGGGHKDSAGASIYNEIEVDEQKSSDELTYEELDENKDNITTENMEANEYVWRTEGKPAIQFIKSHLKSEL